MLIHIVHVNKLVWFKITLYLHKRIMCLVDIRHQIPITHAYQTYDGEA